jgi:hypothetical protein
MDKRMQSEGREMSWFELYLEIKEKLESRIFELEERVVKLENSNRSRNDMRIG